MKTFFIFASAFFISGSLAFADAGPSPASAPAPSVPVPTDDCAVVAPADIAALSAIENDATLTPSQELTRELTLRKQLLSETITCAVQDANVLKETLNAVVLPADGGAAVGVNGEAIRSRLSGKIDDALNFYAIESAKVNGAGVSATQAIAKEMLAWRTVNYVPLAGDVTNFGLWATNQALFETAGNRLTQTGRVVTFIEGITTTNGSLQAALEAAQASFTAAQSANAAAGLAIGEAQPADMTLGLIQQSLQSLANAYQTFSDLNGLIQNFLPASN